MNTAARMESTGVKNRIHLSEETATRLKAVGKCSWLEERADEVHAKGKGVMKTYFLNMSKVNMNQSEHGSKTDSEDSES